MPRRATLLRYACAGGFAALVDLGIFHALQSAGTPVLAAAAASFLAAAAVNYALSSTWVFAAGGRSPGQAGRFALAAGVGLCVNAAITALLAAWLPVPPTLAKAGGIACAFLANYAMNARWVFGARRDRTVSAASRAACADGPRRPHRTTRRAAGAAAWRRWPSARG